MEKLPDTIEECHQIIRLLQGALSDLSKKVELLAAENRDLKERLNGNSSNSSLPPSKDIKKKKKQNGHKPSGKRSGGQPGHKGYYRELLASEAVDSIEQCALPKQCVCGGEIHSTGEYLRHQVYELPKLKLQVTEYQLEKGCCENCRTNQIASLPEGISWGITGPRLTSFMSELVTKYGLSRREQRKFLKEQLDFELSLGTVFNKQKVVNAALEAPVSELLPIVKESNSVYVDETGHNRDGKSQWLWGIVSMTAGYFSIEASRGKKVLKDMLSDFKNTIVSDRYSAYEYFDSSQRQLCWAHLKRDFTKLSEKEDKTIARIGRELLENEGKLFKIWHEFKSEQISREELLKKAKPIRQRVGELLEQGSYTAPELKASRMCKNLLKNFYALWTFLETEGVEPTNNHAERSLRPSVIWRKKYFCTRSDYGSQYVARSASIQATCKLQGKSSFNFLCEVMHNHFSGKQTSISSIMA